MRVLAVVPVLMGLVACGDPCERLADAMERKAKQCDIEVDEGNTSEDECTEDEQELADCMIPCVKDVSCEAMNGEDMEGAMDYMACLSDCMGVEAN